MRCLVCYDVETVTKEGRRRLRRVAKFCESYGQRAQKSVFEIQLDDTTLVTFKHRIAGIIEPQSDSLRIYFLDEDAYRKTIQIGESNLIDFEGPLIV